MTAEHFEVSGRRFLTREDYEAALRDKVLIDALRKQVDFGSPGQVLKLYGEMNAGQYRFESALGNDFDDEIYELVDKYKNRPAQDFGAKTRSKPAKKRRDRKESPPAGPAGPNPEIEHDAARLRSARLRKREKRLKWLRLLCGIVAAACFGYFGIYLFFMERTGTDYRTLASLKNSAALSAPQEPVVHKVNTQVELPDVLDEYKTLYNKNKKLIGWLKIDDTIIDYPVMQTSSNEYYLNHNYNQEYDKNGSIFLDSSCSVYPRSTNLIVYGHHMKSGQMFGQLNLYARESYYEDHKIIQFDTIYEKGNYEVMYVFRSRVYNENDIVFKYYQFFDANSEQEFTSYMREMADMSLYDTGVTARFGDQLLTLSTCDNSQEEGRFVVVARKKA